MGNEILNITVDDIKRLRFEKKYAEADALLKTFRDCGRKNIGEGERILHNKSTRIYRFKHSEIINNSIIKSKIKIKENKKKLGICLNCKNKARVGKLLCEKCAERQNRNGKIWRKKMKNRNEIEVTK